MYNSLLFGFSYFTVAVLDAHTDWHTYIYIYIVLMGYKSIFLAKRIATFTCEVESDISFNMMPELIHIPT